MSLAVVTPPAPLLTVAEAREHLRIDGTGEDVYLTGLVAAAQGTIDGPMGWLGRSIGEQTLELRVPAFEGFCGGGIVLPCGPVIQVVSLAYVAADGSIATVDPALYGLDDDAIVHAQGALWPTVQLRSDGVRVRYRAGHSATDGVPPVATVPAPIVHALKVMVGLLYENRLGTAADLQTNPTVASLLGPWRVWGR